VPPRSRGPILVVDDDAGFRTLIGKTLDHFGHEVLEASTGEQALEAAGESPPRLVVLDVCLPDISGVHSRTQAVSFSYQHHLVDSHGGPAGGPELEREGDEAGELTHEEARRP
jgi:DNA-binding NtrC family response regulator